VNEFSKGRDPTYKYVEIKDILEISKKVGENSFILILDGIEDPHNLGAILRTAEAVGLHGVVIRKARQVPVNETVLKVSTGAALLVPVARVPNIAEAIRFLQKEGILFESKNKGAHLIVRHNGKVIDYWPGTGKFIDRATGKGKRGIRPLLKYLRTADS